MAGMKSDRINDEFDAMRLEVSNVADDCRTKSKLVGLTGIERQAWMFKELELRAILAKYPKKNVPTVTKGS